MSWRRYARRRWRRISRIVRYGRHARLIRRVLLWGTGGLIGLSILWLIVTALIVRSDLSKLQSRVQHVKALTAQGKIAEARSAAAKLPSLATRVHVLTSGPVWWAAAEVPYVGRPAHVTRQLAAASDDLASQVLPELLDVATAVDPARLRGSGDTIKLLPIIHAAPRLERSARFIDRIDLRVRTLPSHTWLSVVNDGRTRLVLQLAAIRNYVDAAARAATVLPAMLGRTTPQRYFIALQNEAEMRGTGGLPGSFAIAVVSYGRIRFTHFENDTALLPAKTGLLVKTGLDFGSEYNALYGASDPTSSFVDSNASPEFAYAARIWAAMWQKVSGERVDGAVALDPGALSHFLAATGPVTGPDGSSLTASNVVDLTQKDSYALFPSNEQRKTFLVGVLRAVARKVISGESRPIALVQAASVSARERRMAVWSRDSRIERVIKQTDYSASLPRRDRPLAGVVVNNAAAGKLDYYLQRSLIFTRTGCGPQRDVVATVGLTNAAPASGLPAYVTDRYDHPPPGYRLGDNHLVFDYYATGGARLQSVTVNGKPATAAVQPIDGHSVFRLDVELRRGTTTTIVLHLSEPAGKGDPVIWRQPGVTPLAVQEFNQSC